eukprot:6184587-Pleurochrysis_carterae.AAC.2
MIKSEREQERERKGEGERGREGDAERRRKREWIKGWRKRMRRAARCPPARPPPWRRACPRSRVQRRVPVARDGGARGLVRGGARRLDAVELVPRRHARKDVVCDDGEGVDVHLLRVLLVPVDLGRHEAVRARLAGHLPLARRRLGLWQRAQLGEAEIGNLERVRVVEQEVGRLEVSVQNRRLAQMQIVHALCELGRVLHAKASRHALLLGAVGLEQVGERALHQLGEHHLS